MSAASTLHVRNWLRPTQMVCGVSIDGRSSTMDITQVTCDVCVLRVLRTGQGLGWNEDDIRYWDLALMAKLWSSQDAHQHQHR